MDDTPKNIEEHSLTKETCKHQYECVYEGWDSETYECKFCGDRYKLHYEEMK